MTGTLPQGQQNVVLQTRSHFRRCITGAFSPLCHRRRCCFVLDCWVTCAVCLPFLFYGYFRLGAFTGTERGCRYALPWNMNTWNTPLPEHTSAYRGHLRVINRTNVPVRNQQDEPSGTIALSLRYITLSFHTSTSQTNILTHFLAVLMPHAP